MKSCILCGTDLPEHQRDCKLPADMVRLDRVLASLRERNHNSILQYAIARVMATYGRAGP